VYYNPSHVEHLIACIHNDIAKTEYFLSPQYSGYRDINTLEWDASNTSPATSGAI
jgi:hypothetical protein